jgi:ferric-dicitrate binding protein FerR (iron transport regulator)
MSTHDPEQPTIGDTNVERLISKAYQPEHPDPALLGRVTERMSTAARDAGPRLAPAGAAPDEVRRFLPLLTGMAAAIAGLFVLFHAVFPPHRETPRAVDKKGPPPTVTKSFAPALPPGSPQGLKARAKPVAAPPQVAKVGEVLETATQGRRAVLPDGSVVFLKANTVVQFEEARRLTLVQGEVFVEVSPRPQGSGDLFTVHAGNRAVKALGTKFAVGKDAQGTRVLVTQGKVQISGFDQPIAAGTQVLDLDKGNPEPAPRASHTLDWTKELMAAADSPLVPESKYSGGALIAVDSDGQEAKLTLRRYYVDVHIEDGFARTVIDQTYFNHANWRMEGTFYFPLPPDASLSRLAMYVDGNLMEGGMAERNYARQVFETIMYAQKDPALLEWVDGSTFKMRVFPLEARQEKRIIIGYTQRLPSLYGRLQYRFPAGHSLGVVNDWSFHGRVKNGKDLLPSSDSHLLLQGQQRADDRPSLKLKLDGQDWLIDGKEQNSRLDRDVTLNLVDPAGGAGLMPARFSTLVHEGQRYLMLRYRPELPVAQRRQNRQWVFLFEASGDRDPMLARVQIEVMRSLLNNAEDNDTFVLLTAGTRVRSLASGPLQVTPENIREALNFLESTHLIGALDLNQALAAVLPYVSSPDMHPHLVHVGSGVAAMGERRPDVLARQLPRHARYVGVAVGKRWSRDFMKTAAERTGGYYTQINPDEPVSWRGFELSATLNTPRLMDIKVLPENGPAQFLLHANAVAHGEEICALARVAADGKSADGGSLVPKSVTVVGTLDGELFEKKVPVPPRMPEAGHLPRTWAKLEIERLLAEDAEKHREQIIDLSKKMYVMTPFTSLLVLENEEMYERFKVDRGRHDHWAPYETPKKIEVQFEPEIGQPVDARFAPKTEKPHANQVLATITMQVPARVLTWPDSRQEYSGRQAISALESQLGFPRDEGAIMAFAPPARALTATGSTRLHSRRAGLFNGDDLTNFNVDRLEDLSVPGPIAGEWLSRGKRNDALNLGQLMAAGVPQTFSKRPPGFGGGFAGGLGGPRGRPLFDAMSTDLDLPMANDGVPVFYEMRGALKDMEVMERSNAFLMLSDGTPVQELRKELRSLSEATSEVSRVLRVGGGVRKDQKQLFRSSEGPRLYGRPSFSNDERVFIDLLRYAPGMTTTAADIEGVVEAEAAPKLANIPGAIDPEARAMIEKARQGGWQNLVLPQPGSPGAGSEQKIVFDGQGRYAYERTTPLGLREQVVGDGKTHLVLYPDLGIGGRRQLSRFHRADFASLVPWLVPPAEDLARGADVKKVGDHVVAVVSRGAAKRTDDDGKPVPYAYAQLLFEPSGRLAERRIVEVTFDDTGKPKERNLLVESYDPNGIVKIVNSEGKELAKREFKLADAPAPNVTPDLAKLVVLPLPFRTPEHMYQALQLDSRFLYHTDEAWTLEYLDSDQALALLAAEFAGRHPARVWELQRRCFINRGDNRLGFYILHLALRDSFSGDPDFRKLLDADPASPLARYLALAGSPLYLRMQERFGANLGESVGPADHFLTRLASFRDLHLRWQYVTQHSTTMAERRRVFEKGLAFVERNANSVLGWAMLTQLQDRYSDVNFNRQIAQAWKLFIDDSNLGYVAQYEHARSLLGAGLPAESAMIFREIYDKMLQAKVLPPIDGTFRQALLHEGKGADEWTPLMQATAAALLKDKLKLAVIVLAWQCWELGDEPLAENLLQAALDRPADEAERLRVTLAAIDYLMGTSQDARADGLLTPLLDDKEHSKHPELWRLAAQIAQRRGQAARAVTCLETALEIEFQDLPDVVNLQEVRQDYGRLLQHYESLAGALTALKLDRSPDLVTNLVARTVRAADRWRALDRDSADVCERAARILKQLGYREMAWDYVTTPIGQRPNEAGPWHNLARRLGEQGELDLANLAFKAAFDAEPTDAQVLWDQAQNLRRAGKQDEARLILKRIVAGDWQPRFAWLKSQARWQLEGR